MKDPGRIVGCLQEMADHAVMAADQFQPLPSRLEFIGVAFELSTAERRDGERMFSIGEASAARRQGGIERIADLNVGDMGVDRQMSQLGLRFVVEIGGNR